MMSSVYESLIHLLSRSESRLKHGHSAVLLLAVLVQFRKNESTNPYKLKLSILDQGGNSINILNLSQFWGR